MSSQTPHKRVLYSRTLALTMVGVFSIVSILTSSFAFSPQKANAALTTNSTLNFQARLETNTGAIVPDGYYNVQFKLYDGDTPGGPAGQGIGFAGTNLWTETWYDSNGVSAGNDNRVQVKDGYLTANLGSQTAFPSTINWDQNLWITLNIGGVTQTATPSWDGEMNPRLALTGVPYAFKAAQLAQFNATTGFTSTLSIIQPTVGNQVFQIPDMGAAGTYTLCVQGGSCGGGGGGGGVTLQATTPGTADTGNFNVTGTGIAAKLQAGTFDTASATTLNLGTTNATSISIGTTASTGTITLGQSTASNTINIGNATIAASNTGAINIGTSSTSTGKTVITIGSTNGGSSILLQAGTGNLQLQTQGGTLGVGNNAVAQSLIIGNTTAATTISLQGGNTATALALSAASGGTLSFGSSGAANTINVGNTGAAGAVVQTINIGTNSTAAGTNTVNIGNAAATASAIAIQGGTGASAVAISAGSGGTLAFGSSGVANTINIGNMGTAGAVAQTIRIGTNSTAGATNSVIIGNSAATASTVAIAGGTGATALALTTGAGGTLSLGDNGVSSTVQVGNTSGSVAQTINIGTNSAASANNTVNIGSLIDGSTTTIQGGTGGINLVINNTTLGVAVKTNSNLTNAFLIQNSDAQPIFQADTTHAVNLTNNGGFDSPLGGSIGGWAATGTGASVARTSTAGQIYSGVGALAVTLGSASGTGAQLQSTGIVGSSLATGTYTISFYAKGSAAISGLAVSFSGGGTCTLNSTSVSSTGFQRYLCTVTTTGATTSINITAATTAQTLYIDSVQIQSGSTATPYTTGTLHLTGVIGSPIMLQNASDSTSIFQIQNAAGTNTLFNVDTLNGRVGIGTSSAAYPLDVVGDINSSTTVRAPSFDTATAAALSIGTGNATSATIGKAAGTTPVSIPGAVTLGKTSSVNGSLVFANSSNANTVTVNTGVTSAASYALTLPTALGNSGNCLKQTNGAGALGFGVCGTASTLQDTYNSSGTTSPQILLSSTNGGLKISDGSPALSGNLFAVQNNAATATYLGISASALTLQNSSGYNAMVFDSTSNHLKIYEAVASPTRYADIYYDNANSEAVFTASSGTTRVGSGSGNVTITLTNPGDVFTYTKTATLSSAYSSDDALIQRNITAGANSLGGSVLRVESISTGTGPINGSILWLNQNNTSATGNLILGTTGGAGNNKFQVDTAGNVTIGTSATFSGGTFSGVTFTGPGAVGVTAGAGSALTLTSPTAATWSTTTGNLTLQAGGANKVVLKPGTDSSDAFELQNASGSPMLLLDSSAGALKVGGGDVSANGTPVLLVVDHSTSASDPTGINGGMYYNESMNKFRCYQNSQWADCTTGETYIRKTADQLATQNSTTMQNATDLTYGLATNATYSYEAIILVDASNSTADWQYTVTVPTGSTIINRGETTLGQASSSNSLCNFVTSGSACSVATSGTGHVVLHMVGLVTTSSTSGNWQFQFAQNVATASAGSPSVLANSIVKFTRIQ